MGALYPTPVRGSELNEIVAAKVRQAIPILREQDVALWIVQFARETHEHPEPVQDLVVGTSVMSPAAFLISAGGRTIAVVGTGDEQNVRDVGAYDEVIPYVTDIGPALSAVLADIDPPRIGLSYSPDDTNADNLTLGMYLRLKEYLQSTPYEERLVPGEDILVALRGRKLPVEIQRMRVAIDRTLEIFTEIERRLRPGVTERAIFDAIHDMMQERGLTPAWDGHHDPVVNFGPNSNFGPAGPTEIALQPGMLIHIDLGVKLDGYCSDLQRMWYLLRDTETEAPADLLERFQAVVSAKEAGFLALKPGAIGWHVDRAARSLLTTAGVPEPQFSFGHQLGRSTHDAGCLLGARWPRYGNRPYLQVEEGNVFTVELSVPSPAGVIGLEDDVLVTASGAEYLSAPQTKLMYLSG